MNACPAGVSRSTRPDRRSSSAPASCSSRRRARDSPGWERRPRAAVPVTVAPPATARKSRSVWMSMRPVYGFSANQALDASVAAGHPGGMATVAEQLVRTLRDAGVERIYGIVGDSLNPIVDAVRRTDGIEWVHVRHEETAAFAAAAEAQVTGKLAVCAGSCGPGNLHLINGLFDAHRSGAPVLAIASHIPSNQIGTGFFQETHPEQLFTECSFYSELVSQPEQMPRMLRIAMQTAVG